LVFITAEIGVNWDGDFQIIEQMMTDAKNAGCDAVKLQAFDEKIVSKHNEKERLLKSSVTPDNIEQIHSIANRIGIEWYCTPMFIDAVDYLDDYVKRYKIRFSDSEGLHKNESTPIISKVLETNKEIIISTQKSPRNLELYKNKNIKWLYVVPKYPCPLDDVNFLELNDFNGYSNHCSDFIAPLTATILGAEMVEIHITPNKEKNYLDNPVSFDPDQTRELVQLIQNAGKIRK
tara:strand:+ start:613 stop:1311 length:699 start_codon:yes stop_codon:yes gene_type:complete